MLVKNGILGLHSRPSTLESALSERSLGDPKGTLKLDKHWNGGKKWKLLKHFLGVSPLEEDQGAMNILPEDFNPINPEESSI